MDEELCQHLIEWLNTFEGLEGRHSSVSDLTDGVAMAEALTQIAPEWFDADWISKIKTDILDDNYRLKLSNLKKVLKGMMDYYSEVLNQDLSSFCVPDVAQIGEFSNVVELGRMLQLVLGCAINCEDKEQYIQAIMQLEENVQHSVMNAIQELMEVKESSKLSESDFIKDVTDYSPANKTPSFSAERDHLAQRVHELEDQIRIMKDEKSALVSENEYLQTKRNTKDTEDGNLADQHLIQLQHQVDQLKEENFSLETAKEDYKLRYEQQTNEIAHLNNKVDQLSSLADEASLLKDEMDVLRHTQDKVARYEATIEAYKKKLGELGDMRAQMKTLEDKNAAYMQQTISLEEDSKKTTALKAQVESYKSQIHDLHSKQLEMEKRCDKAEFDSQRLKDKQQSLEAENQRLKQERDMLKETNEELTLNQGHQANLSTQLGDPGVSQFDDMAIGDSQFELKEKIIRLEHQNKVLTLQLEEAENAKTQVLQSDLDVASERVNVLQTENRQLNQQILQLKGDLEDASSAKIEEAEKLSQEDQEVRRKLKEHLAALKESNEELQRKKQHIESLESTSASNSEEITVLRDQLMKKDEQMREMEDRYKKYLEKAKTMIRSLDPDKTNTDQQVNVLQSRLQEKEKLIEHLERDHERMKMTKEREEKLIVSAWYELSMQLHKKAADERLAGSAGLSFLAKQRQAASLRRSSMSPSPSHRKGSNVGS